MQNKDPGHFGDSLLVYFSISVSVEFETARTLISKCTCLTSFSFDLNRFYSKMSNDKTAFMIAINAKEHGKQCLYERAHQKQSEVGIGGRLQYVQRE